MYKDGVLGSANNAALDDNSQKLHVMRMTCKIKNGFICMNIATIHIVYGEKCCIKYLCPKYNRPDSHY